MTGPDGPGTSGIVYLLCFDDLNVPYPGAPLYCCARHYNSSSPVARATWRAAWRSTGRRVARG